MSVPFKEVPGSPPVPDVDALMQRVREGVADKICRGVYAPADLDALRSIGEEPRERSDFGPAPDDDIARLHSSWDPLGPYTFTSHRGRVGRLLVTAKQWLRRLASPVAAVTLARQSEFNGAVARLLPGACHGVQSLEADRDALLRRLNKLECRNLELQARCERLQAEVRGLEARVASGGGAEEPG